MYRCKHGVLWKESVASYFLNGIENTMRLENKLKNKTYKPRNPKKFMLTHPKPREAVSIAYIDRIYQRSLNDNILYPVMTNSFIFDNMACQKGKGTDKFRNRFDDKLRKHFRKYGTDGYVLQCDVHGYYPNMNHQVTESTFKEKLPEVVYNNVEEILRFQYSGDVGYNPGSQMIQIAGISVLDKLDHFIKERLGIKFYMRYMDDFILVHTDKEYLKYCKDEIEKFLASMKFELHPDKTNIFPLKNGVTVLGFKHRITSTGKIIRTIDSKNVANERRKLRRMVNLSKKGILSKKKVDECYKSWKSHAAKGNSFKLLQRMDLYYKELWR